MPTVNGEYFLPPVYEATPGERIRADQHNIPLRDVAQGLTDRVMRNGTSPMTGNLPMNGHKVTGMAEATAAGDAVRKSQMDTAISNTETAISNAETAAKDLANATGILPLNRGGTGGTTQAAARSGIGITVGSGGLNRLNESVNHIDSSWASGASDLPGLPSPKQIADATGTLLSWKRVGKVPVGTGAAVTITGLDLTKETKFVVSYVRNNGTAARDLRMRASEDGGASWRPTWGVSATANWSAGRLRGAIDLFSDSANGVVIASSLLSGAAGADALQYAPIEVSLSGSPIFTPDCDTVELSWNAGNFAASGIDAPETDCIIIYQRG